MRKMKRGLSLVLASIMATALVGCSGGENTETTNTATTTENKETTGTTQVADENQEEITLRFVSWQTNHDEQNQKVAAAYKELHPNINVQFDYVGDMNSNDYLTKTDIMLMGGEAMDILMAPNYASYIVRAESGSYLSLDDYFTEEGTTAEDAYNVIVRVNDQTYGIPGEMKYNLVLINKDMLDAAGLDVPSLDWTWDDYREYAEKLTSGSGADTKYGSYFHSWGSCNLWGISSGKGGSTIFNDDKTLTFDNPNLAKFLQLRYDMENVDHSSTPLADVKALNMNYRDQFFNGNIAMLPMGTAMLSDIGNEKYAHDFVTTFARQPLWDKDGEHYNEAGGNIKCSVHCDNVRNNWCNTHTSIKKEKWKMIYLQLFWSFIQIGMFSFGGGYAAMPLIQGQVVTDHGWLTMSEFTDLITISQMTPGPIAVNSATFVGLKIAGIPGAVVATLGCILPSCIIVTVLAKLYLKYRSMDMLQGVLRSLRPAVVAMIASAGILILMTAFWGSNTITFTGTKWVMVLIFAICVVILRKTKMNPIWVMVLAGVIKVFVSLV